MLRFIFLVMILICTRAYSTTIDQYTKNIKISDNLAVKLTDQKLSVEDILAMPETFFQKYDGKSFGFTNETLWAKYFIENNSNVSDWFVTLYVSHVGKFQVYKVTCDGIVTEADALGRDLDTSLRRISLKNPTIPITLDPGFRGHLLFRAESQNNLTLDLGGNPKVS